MYFSDNLQGDPKKTSQRFVAKISCRGPILLFHRCFGTRILSLLHQGTLQIPFQNRKGLKNAKLDAQMNPQNSSIIGYQIIRY